MKEEALRLGLLLALSAALLAVAYQLPSPIFLNFGPNDSRYLWGFREDFEADGTTFIHWSGREGEVTLPVLLLRGPARVTFRFKRHASSPADVRVFAGGIAVDRFVVSEQDFTVRSAFLAENPRRGEPLRIEFLSQSSDPRPLGIALDWLAIDPPRPVALVLPSASGWLALLGTVAGFFLFSRVVGFSRRASFGLGAGAALALSVWAAFNKLAPLHAALELGIRPHAFFAIVAVFYRLKRLASASALAHPAARYAALACYVGTAARLLALFHPEFYHPDVRVHSKFVSVIWTEGVRSFLTHYTENQHRFLLGLEPLDGEWVAFPYPPLFYLVVYPLSLLGLPVDDWVKLLPTFLLGVEALLVFAIAIRLGAPPRGAAAAAWIHATAPFVVFRLTTAFYPSLLGHFLDVLVGVYLLLEFKRMERLWVDVGLAVLVLASLLAYTGSVFVLGILIPAFAAVAASGKRASGDPARALRVVLCSFAATVVAFFAFYRQYVPELLPRLLGAGGTTLSFTPVSALTMMAGRFLMFFGPVFAPLLILALVVTRRQFTHELARPLAGSVAVAFLGLNFLNGGLGGVTLFRSTKDDLLLLPLAAIVLGVLWAMETERRRLRRLLAGLLLGGWIAWDAFALVRGVEERFVRPDYRPGVAKLYNRPRREASLLGAPPAG